MWKDDSNADFSFNNPINSTDVKAYLYWEDKAGLVMSGTDYELAIRGTGENAEIEVPIDITKGKGNAVVSLNTFNPNYNYFSSKTELYTDYEVMDQDAIIATCLDIYADEVILKDDFGDILRITSNNENIKKILHNLFYDVLNIEFNLWPWVRNMCKYGDLFLHLDIQEEIGIVSVTPLSAYEIIREEGMNVNNPYHVQFKQLGGGNIIYENFEIAHFRLLTDSNFLPYGRSIVEPARKVWKQLMLMEDAMLIHRIMRAPEKRIFKIDVGNIPPNEVDNYMQRIINQMKKTPYVDEQTGEYNLKFNMMNMLEDYFLPVRGGQSGTSIESLAGMEYQTIEDINYLKEKMTAAMKVPTAFIGYNGETAGKGMLAGQDVRFARTVERVQRIVISELYKIAIIHLYAQGYTDAELLDFELTMTSPSTIYEQEKLTLYTTKVELAGNMLEKKLMSRDWIYENIFNFTKQEYESIEEDIIQDQKDAYRYTKISEEGTDPADPRNQEAEPGTGEPESEEGGKKSGNSETEEKSGKENPFEEGTNPKLEKAYDKRRSKERKTPDVPEGGWPGAGRPKEGMKYNTHEHPRGYDPSGRIAWDNARSNYRNESFAKSLKKFGLNSKPANTKNILKETSMLDEANIMSEEI
jgi:hypothetical protein